MKGGSVYAIVLGVPPKNGYGTVFVLGFFSTRCYHHITPIADDSFVSMSFNFCTTYTNREHPPFGTRTSKGRARMI